MIWYHGVKMGYKLGICFFWFKWAVWLLPWQPLELLGVRADSNLPWTRSRRNTLDSGENHPNRSCLWFLHGSNLLRLSSADQVQMWICSGSALKLHGKTDLHERFSIDRRHGSVLHRRRRAYGWGLCIRTGPNDQKPSRFRIGPIGRSICRGSYSQIQRDAHPSSSRFPFFLRLSTAMSAEFVIIMRFREENHVNV